MWGTSSSRHLWARVINAASVINNTAGEPFSGTQLGIQKMLVAQLIVAAAAAHS